MMVAGNLTCHLRSPRYSSSYMPQPQMSEVYSLVQAFLWLVWREGVGDMDSSTNHELRVDI